MSVATFNPSVFLGRYPEFTAAYNANPALFASMFAEAGLYLDNTDCSIVQDVGLRTVLLNVSLNRRDHRKSILAANSTDAG